MNYDIYRFDKIDSTNSHLLKLGEEGFPEGTVVVSDEQTSGRGRLGRSWESEPQTNLLFSLLLRPHFLQRDEVFILTFAAAVSAARAIEKVAQVQPQLKWPNDVLLNDRKVCGILLESDFDLNGLNHVVLGIGVNVNQENFSPAISNRAISLRQFTGKTFDRDEILFSILSDFSSVYESLQRHDFYSVMKKWRDRSVMLGEKISVSVAGNTFNGICDGVTDDGALVLRTDDGLKRFTAGDVSILKA